MRHYNVTFRSKILVSLMGIVILFLGVLQLVVRYEISKQIRGVTEQTRERSHQAFNELERLYHEELLRFSNRISQKNRVPAALQEAVEEEDNQVLIDAASYELNLAQIPLAIFTDETGEPVVTLPAGKTPDQPAAGLEGLQIQKLINREAANVSGYHVIKNRLFITQGVVLSLFGRPVGTVTIGFPADNALARRMGNVIQAETAFIVNGQILSSTPLDYHPGLKEQMKAAADVEEPLPITLNGSRWLLVSEPLIPGGAGKGRRVIAVSLEEFLAPLLRFKTVFTLAGVFILLISILLGISISRGLTAPINRLVAGTQRVAKGDYSAHVILRGRDELSTLAESFNRMTDGLLLKERYRGILDKVVSPEVAEEMVKGNITLGGENREVTTLFADIRGFTAMTEGMEPQEVIAMLNQYMERAGAAVEAVCGVVDKYVGDQIMAIFGAPVSQPEDPLRAVRAALKMNDNLDRLNQDRRAANQPEIKIGIGINTGLAVAGNMGSAKRLNYTVLGESVNVAARLCSQAKPSEILISETTYAKTAEAIEVREYQAMPMKGVSKPIKVFKVEGMKKKISKLAAGLLALMLLLPGATAGLHAEPAPGPGIHYISADGRFQVDFSGRLQLTGYLPGEAPALLITETDPFAAGRLNLFADIFWGDRLYGLLELQADRGEVPSNGPLEGRIRQAFLRYTFLPSQNLHLQVGIFVSPFGAYSQRHGSTADPFIRPPLSHEYRTMICPGLAPGANDKFIGWKNIPHLFRPTGAPAIWGVPYQAGAMVSGDFGKWSFRAAAMNSAPSSDPVQWKPDFKQTWNYSFVSHLGYRFSPELTVGVSFNYGPYSLGEIKETLPDGYDINDYNQILWGINAVYTRGRLAVRAEWFHDTWEVPNVIDPPVDISYYLEISYKFLPGFYAALRYNGMHFNKIAYTNGETSKWDYDVQRLQAAVGYRFSPRLEVRAEYMWNRSTGPEDPKDNLLALQWIWQF